MPRPQASEETPYLLPLAQRAFESWHRAMAHIPSSTVVPSVPILFFGDVAAYLDSPIRVLTVGLNPSHVEFPDGDPFRRFAAARNLRGVEEPESFAAYVAGLNNYFHDDQNPYRNWFSCYEPMLNGLGGSYYPGADTTALHTDICSPVATDPTWSRLPRQHRSLLIDDGRSLWHDLVRALKPQVILASVARSHIESISFPTGPWSELHRVERKNPYVIQKMDLSVEGGSRPALVFGRAAQKPFSLISNQDKQQVGRKIRELMDHV